MSVSADTQVLLEPSWIETVGRLHSAGDDHALTRFHVRARRRNNQEGLTKAADPESAVAFALPYFKADEVNRASNQGLWEPQQQLLDGVSAAAPPRPESQAACEPAWP